MRSRVLRSVLTLSVAMALFVVFMGSSSPSAHGGLRAGNEVAMLAQQQRTSSLLTAAAQADVNPAANQPQPDYNGEGRYDWQKCKASNDPDCWKNEGERVGSYWENFGQRMKTFWMNFRQTMHDFFVGKKATDDTAEATATTTTAEKKTSKKKKSKNKGESAAAETIVAPALPTTDLPAAGADATAAPEVDSALVSP
jgi:hypothetical protein